ncbi:Tim10/DDP family zinc finger-domain-containing protein [Panaeolus papilionaceus]|nr:Tim10/DDP family zinc finger-domain-containing protein [Panaeolus papilionaceus]
MADLFSRSGSNPQPDAQVLKEQTMTAIRQELALVNVQELMNKSGDRCYAKCVTKPGDSLSNSEKQCLSRCFDRYMDAFNIVSRTYTARLAKERQQEATF